MSWDEILAMDEEALNLAIEALEGRVWTKTTLPGVGHTCWLYLCPDGHPTYASVPHLHTTASWERCMPLAWRQLINIVATSEPNTWMLWQEGGRATKLLYVTTEHGARIAICRLALWVAQQQEVPHGE